MSDDDSCERCECCGVRIYRCQHDAGARFPSCTEMLRAAEAGNIRRVRRLHENGCPWDEGTCAYSAKHGHFDCLKYLHENGCPWHEGTCNFAAHYGHLDCLQYAHENGCPWQEWTCTGAAIHGHLDCLQYAHENGCPWDVKTCSDAAYHGHLECLKYAHEHGCPWDESACALAAQHGRLDCLKYLHENGCPWDAETCEYAAKCGHIDCLKYAYENGCAWSLVNELLPDVKTALDILQEMRETLPNDTYEIAQENLQALHDDHSGASPSDAGLDEFERWITNVRDVSRSRTLVHNTMTALDEVRETISNGSYVRMATCLKAVYDLIVVDEFSDEDDDFSDEDDE